MKPTKKTSRSGRGGNTVTKAKPPQRNAWYHPLFNHMAETHGLYLLESECADIMIAGERCRKLAARHVPHPRAKAKLYDYVNPDANEQNLAPLRKLRP